MKKALFVIIGIYLFAFVFLYDFGGSRNKIYAARVKRELVDFLQAQKKKSSVSESKLLNLEKAIYLKGNGYTIRKLNEKTLLAEPIIKNCSLEEDIFKRLIFFNFKKLQNPNFRVDLKEGEVITENKKI